MHPASPVSCRVRSRSLITTASILSVYPKQTHRQHPPAQHLQSANVSSRARPSSPDRQQGSSFARYTQHALDRHFLSHKQRHPATQPLGSQSLSLTSLRASPAWPCLSSTRQSYLGRSRRLSCPRQHSTGDGASSEIFSRYVTAYCLAAARYRRIREATTHARTHEQTNSKRPAVLSVPARYLSSLSLYPKEAASQQTRAIITKPARRG